MNDHSTDAIERYVKRILEIQSKNTILLESDISAIAKELQLTDTELVLIEKEFKNHFDRGMGFMKYKNWPTAITELEQAVDLKPYHYHSSLMLASSFEQLYYQTNDEQYKERALSIANRCIDLDVKNAEAYRIVSNLQNSSVGAKIGRKVSKSLPKGRKKRNLVAVLGVLGMIIMMDGGFTAALTISMFMLFIAGLLFFAVLA